jgi:hypothetical protein
VSERLYTFEEVATGRLRFPSAEALKKYLARRPGLVEVLYVRDGRSTKRLLSEADVVHLQEIRVHRDHCQEKFTGTLHRDATPGR